MLRTSDWCQQETLGFLIGMDRKYRIGPEIFRDALAASNQGTLIYRRTDNLRAVQLLLGHTKIESTVTF